MQDKTVKWWPGKIAEKKSLAIYIYIVYVNGRKRPYHIGEIKENLTKLQVGDSKSTNEEEKNVAIRPVAGTLYLSALIKII